MSQMNETEKLLNDFKNQIPELLRLREEEVKALARSPHAADVVSWKPIEREIPFSGDNMAMLEGWQQIHAACAGRNVRVEFNKTGPARDRLRISLLPRDQYKYSTVKP